MGNIKVMSESLTNKIAAGEVVERCSSVVKELVENSIDAGATCVEVSLVDAGMKEIKVKDNGKGMDREDAILCFTPHATSKIRNCLLYTSPSPRDKRQSRMPSSA